jgi:hypothetical protein
MTPPARRCSRPSSARPADLRRQCEAAPRRRRPASPRPTSPTLAHRAAHLRIPNAPCVAAPSRRSAPRTGGNSWTFVFSAAQSDDWPCPLCHALRLRDAVLKEVNQVLPSELALELLASSCRRRKRSSTSATPSRCCSRVGGWTKPSFSYTSAHSPVTGTSGYCKGYRHPVHRVIFDCSE